MKVKPSTYEAVEARSFFWGTKITYVLMLCYLYVIIKFMDKFLVIELQVDLDQIP
jgi:hypothetical protein